MGVAVTESASKKRKASATGLLPAGPAVKKAKRAPRTDTENARSLPSNSPQSDSHEDQEAANRLLNRDVEFSDAMRLCASYALQSLSYDAWRDFAIVALVVDNFVKLLYYDHSICIECEPVNFFMHPLRFIALIQGLKHLSQSQSWDFRTFTPRLKRSLRSGRLTADGDVGHDHPALHVKLRNNVELRLKNCIYLQDCLIGRGTCVVEVEQVNAELGGPVWGEDCDLVMKLAWPDDNNESGEVEIIRKATEKAKELGDVWVLDHLPEVVYAEDYRAVSVDSDSDLHGVQDRLAQKFGDAYKRKVLRVIVQRKLKSIKKLEGCIPLYNVFYDVFRCGLTLFRRFLCVL